MIARPVFAAGAVALALLPGIAPALEDGAEIYRDACAACHGPGARGDGPSAATLTVPPPDLTLFAARNDGVFDRGRMVRLIDGREGLSAHGGPMPMYGGLLTGPAVTIEGVDGGPVDTTARILAIVNWLEGQQRETDQ